MKEYKVYEYIGSYGGGFNTIELDTEDFYKNDKDYEFKGIFKIPDNVVEFIIDYIE